MELRVRLARDTSSPNDPNRGRCNSFCRKEERISRQRTAIHVREGGIKIDLSYLPNRVALLTHRSEMPRLSTRFSPSARTRCQVSLDATKRSNVHLDVDRSAAGNPDTTRADPFIRGVQNFTDLVLIVNLVR
jgi:hypothetical protein